MCVQSVCSKCVFKVCVQSVCSKCVFKACVQSVYSKCVQNVCSRRVFKVCLFFIIFHNIIMILILFLILSIIGLLLNYYFFGSTSTIMTFISIHLFILSIIYKKLNYSLKSLLRLFAILIFVTNFFLIINVAKLPLITLVKKNS